MDKLFAGNACRDLAKSISKLLSIPLSKVDIGKFSDGETSVTVKETVRGCDCYIIQSTCPPVNDNLMELLVLADALRRSAANRIIAVIPYFGYGRQDRRAKSHDPITARLVAQMIQAAGIDHVVTIDLHASQIQGFFDIPVDNLSGISVAVEHISEIDSENSVVVSPDLGSVARARHYAELIGSSLAIIDKRRPKPNVSEVMNIIGDVSGKRAIIIDDMVDTAGTLCNCAKALKENGAVTVDAFASHGVMSGPAWDRVEKSDLNSLIFLDTIPIERRGKVTTISVEFLLAKAIDRLSRNMSLGDLFK